MSSSWLDYEYVQKIGYVNTINGDYSAASVHIDCFVRDLLSILI